MPLTIRKNLWDFLSIYQSRVTPESRIWIDAICIDQENTKERNHQVTMMRDIYSDAQSVIAWLGKDVKDTELAFRLTRGPCSLPADDGYSIRERTSYQQWRSFRSLFRRPYWNRVWIVQEFILPRNVEIWCGTLLADASAFDSLFAVLERLQNPWLTIRACMTDVVESQGWSLFGYRALRWRGLKARSPNLDFSLQSLVRSCSKSHCSDPRDRVYGVLGLVQETDHGGRTIQVDYSKSPLEIFIDAALTEAHSWSESTYLFVIHLAQALGVAHADLARHILTTTGISINQGLMSKLPLFATGEFLGSPIHRIATVSQSYFELSSDGIVNCTTSIISNSLESVLSERDLAHLKSKFRRSLDPSILLALTSNITNFSETIPSLRGSFACDLQAYSNDDLTMGSDGNYRQFGWIETHACQRSFAASNSLFRRYLDVTLHPPEYEIFSTEDGMLGIMSKVDQKEDNGAFRVLGKKLDEDVEQHRDYLYTFSDGRHHRLNFVMRRFKQNPGYWMVIGSAIILQQNVLSQAHLDKLSCHPCDLTSCVLATSAYVISVWKQHRNIQLAQLPLLSTTNSPLQDTEAQSFEYKIRRDQLLLTCNMADVCELLRSSLLEIECWSSLQIHPSSSSPDVDCHDRDCRHVKCNLRQPIINVSSPKRPYGTYMPPTDDVSNTDAGYHDLYKLMTNSEAEWIELPSDSETSSSAPEEENTRLHATLDNQAKSGKCNCRSRHPLDAEKSVKSCSNCLRRHLKRKRREAIRIRRLNRPIQ
jgi:hypothetical protein